MGVYPKLRELLSDVRSFKQGCGIIWKFVALRVANARSVFKMKEVSHCTSLRPEVAACLSKSAHNTGDRGPDYPLLISGFSCRTTFNNELWTSMWPL
jgi:hypothetical protein